MRFLVQARPPQTLEGVRRLLTEAGVDVDEPYGVIIVNPVRGDFVLRANATSQQARSLSEHYGLEFFADAMIAAAGRTAGHISG